MPLSAHSILPFRAYRKPRAEGGFTGVTEFASSAVHFYASEQFRWVDEQLRQDVLEQPTAREALKLARAHETKRRPDWGRVRNRVMCAGIWMQMIEHDAVMDAVTAGQYSFGGVDSYWAPRRGSPVFPKAVEYLGTRLQKAVRVFLYGVGAQIGEFRFESQMKLLFSRLHLDEISVGREGRFGDLAEAWAIKRVIAVRRRHTYTRLHRASEESMRNSLVGMTHAVLFGESATVGRLQAVSKAAGVATRIVSPPPLSPPASSPSAPSGNVRELRRA